MHKLGFPEKLVKLCRFLNNEKYAKVKIGKQISCEYKVNKGLRQGDAITPLLFNVVLETAIRRSKAETRATIFDTRSQIMARADGVVIVRRILQGVKDVFTSLVEQTNDGIGNKLKKT